jgi:hypothetical protein
MAYWGGVDAEDVIVVGVRMMWGACKRCVRWDVGVRCRNAALWTRTADHVKALQEGGMETMVGWGKKACYAVPLGKYGWALVILL